MTAIIDLLPPADRDRILERLAELAELSRLAKEPPVPPDPTDDGQADSATREEADQ